MKPSLALDTSALVSLGHTTLVELIIENFNIIVTDGIIIELENIAKRPDEDGKAANKWLDRAKSFDIKRSNRYEDGEDELFEVCSKEKIPLVTDDLNAIKRFSNDLNCIFSVHIIYLLYKNKFISRERAMLSIEKMRIDRDWKSNMISVIARTLFE